jgi:hypothetical protein
MPELVRKIGRWPGLVLLGLMLVTIPFMAAGFWYEYYQVGFTDAYANYPFGSEEAGPHYVNRDTYLAYLLRSAVVASLSVVLLLVGIWPYRIRWGWVAASAGVWLLLFLL